MKTSIIIKETKQALANNPVKYGEYVDNLVTALTKADRMGNIELGRIFTDAKEKIALGEWSDVDNFKQFVETYTTMSNSRATQILKGYDVYTNLLDYYYETYNATYTPEMWLEDNETENENFVEVLATYTITHFYELKNLEPADVENLAEDEIITPDMSVKELKKAVTDWLKSDEDSDNEENGEDSDNEENSEDSDTEENSEDSDTDSEIYIRNADDAETLYKKLLGMINEGKSLKINLTDLS